MSAHIHDIDRSALDPEILGAQLWETIVALYVEWTNAARRGDDHGVERVEQEMRFFALTYVSLAADGSAVSTGRKAVILSIYAQLGGRDCAHVLTMIDAVIRSEEAAARGDGSLPRDI